jgi:hypothetical protein
MVPRLGEVTASAIKQPVVEKAILQRMLHLHGERSS